MTAPAASVSPFNFGTHAVRVIVKDGAPWFVAKDICDTLGYSNSRKTLADHLDEDEKGVTNSDTLGGNQNLTVINESGLYALVLRSRKPEARKFAKWVTSEVLPAIRKTGKYAVMEQQPLPAIESKTGFITPAQRTTLRGLIAKGCSLHMLSDRHRAQCSLLLDVKFNSKDLRVKAPDFEAAKQYIADYFAEEVKIAAQPQKQQITNVAIPDNVLDRAAELAGHVFADIVKQAAGNNRKPARLLTGANFNEGTAYVQVIEPNAYVLPMDRWPSAIMTEASIPEAAAIMAACANRLNLHHRQTALIA